MCSSVMSTPAAGFPLVRSSTCEVTAMRPPSGLRQQLVEPQARDLVQFARGDRALGSLVVAEPRAQRAEHGLGTEAGGAEDERVAEPPLVLRVPLRQRGARRIVHGADAGLLARGPRPLTGGERRLRARLAEPRVAGDRVVDLRLRER